MKFSFSLERNHKMFLIFVIFFFTTKAMFGSRKILRKEKKNGENDFLMFGFNIENKKKNQI